MKTQKLQIHTLLADHIVQEIREYAISNGLTIAEVLRYWILEGLKKTREENGREN